MNAQPQNEGAIIIHGIGIGAVSRGMVRERATELALINGRPPNEVTKADWDEAMRELTGKGGYESEQPDMKSVPESERWNPNPGSGGHEALVAFDDNEDQDARSIGERLVEEGVEEAGHDQMLAAARENLPVDD